MGKKYKADKISIGGHTLDESRMVILDNLIEGGLHSEAGYISSFTDTNTHLTDAEIAAMGYIKTYTDTNTNTQLSDAQIAEMGYIKTYTDTNTNTQLTSAQIAAMGYLSTATGLEVFRSEKNIDDQGTYMFAQDDGGWTGGARLAGAHNGYGVISMHLHADNYYGQIHLSAQTGDMGIRFQNASSTWGSIYTVHTSKHFSTADVANGKTAHGWGNHASAGYLTSYTDTNTQLTSAQIAAMGYLTALPSHNHDDRYYTEAESNSRFINVTGDTMSGSLDVNADIQANTFTQAAHGIPRNNLGAPTVTEMALFDNQFTPKTTLANNYDDLTDLTFWVQTTSSSAWTEITTFSDDQKRKFLRTNNSNIAIPNGVYKFRVEFVGQGYTFANAMYAYWSSNSHNTSVHVWKYNVNSSSWLQHTNSSATISSWPGHMYLPFSTIPWLESATTHTGHFKSVRIEFTPTWSTGTYSDRVINLYGMQVWGGYPSGRRTPHYYDQNGRLNVTKELSVSDNIRTPLLYDLNNTSYYLDPASTSNLNVINATGGTSTEWNTAHGWGNHADEGYLTSYTDTDTNTQLTSAEIAAMGYTGDQDLSGYFPISGGSLTGSANITGATADFTTVSSWNLAAKAGDGNGYSFWGTGTSYKISMGNSSIYHYGDVPGYSIKTQMDSGSTDRGFTWGRVGAVPIASLNSTSGIFTTEGAIKAPVFYDSNDTNYYLNPASTSNLNIVQAVQFQGSLAGTASNANTLDSFSSESFLRSDADDTVNAGVTYTWARTDTAGIVFVNNTYNTQLAMGGWTTANSSNVSRIRTSSGNLHIDSASNGNTYLNWYSGGDVKTNSLLQSDASLRAPIFYDSNNTSYYVDPNSRSRFNEIQTSDSGAAPRYDTAFYVIQGQHWYGDTGSQSMYIGESGNPVKLRGNLRIGGNANADSGMGLTVEGSSNATSSFRAPIFYDSNDTTYYTNPAGASIVKQVKLINSSTPLVLKVNSSYKSWVHHIASNDSYVFAPSTADGGESWDWANQMSISSSGVVTANNFVLSSDERKKTKIKDLPRDNINTNWKSFEMKNDEGEYRTGVIAQELEETHPEFVNTDPEGFKSVKYIDLLIAKIAELEARLEKLEK